MGLVTRFRFETLCVVASSTICLFLLFILIAEASNSEGNFSSERLYWEYAGRVLGSTYTPGYPEWIQQRVGDVPAPVSYAQAGDQKAPYSNFALEYPPGALAYFTLLRTTADDFATYRLIHQILMALSFVGAVVLGMQTIRFLGAPKVCLVLAAATAPIMVYLIGNFTITRFDSLTAVLAAGAVFLALRSKPFAAGILLGLGACIKIWPVFLFPFLTANRKSALAAATATGTVVICLHLLLRFFGTEWNDILGYLEYATDRPIHSESFRGLLAMLPQMGGIKLEFSFGAWNATGYTPWLNSSIMLYVMAIIFAWLSLVAIIVPNRTVNHGNLAVYRLGFVAFLIVASQSFSGEYMIWLAPLALGTCLSWKLMPFLLLTLGSMLFTKLSYIYSGNLEVVSHTELTFLGLKWACLITIIALTICVSSATKSTQRLES